LKVSKDVVLIHDLRQPNEFSDILAACPQSLKDKGVFDHLAVALYGGDYEHTSLKLLWQRISSEDDSNVAVRKNSNFLARNSVVMPYPQPAFPQKSLLGERLAPMDDTAADAMPHKEDEARLEELTAADQNEETASNPNPPGQPSTNVAGRENRLGSIDRLIVETEMQSVPPSAGDNSTTQVA